MNILAVAVVLVGALTVANFVLSLGIVKRLNSGDIRAGEQAGPRLGVRTGDRLPDLRLPGKDVPLNTADLLGSPCVLGFFTTDCPACADALPAFAEHVSALRAQGGRSVAVVTRSLGSEPELLERLGAVVDHVVLERPGGTATKAFGVRYYPSFVTCNGDGIAVAAGVGVSALDQAAVAR